MGFFTSSSKKHNKSRSNSTVSRPQGKYFNFPPASNNGVQPQQQQQQLSVSGGMVGRGGHASNAGTMTGSNFVPMRDASGWGAQQQQAAVSGSDYTRPRMQLQPQRMQSQSMNNDGVMSQGSFYGQMNANVNPNINAMARVGMPNTRGYVNDARNMNSAYLAQRQPGNYNYYNNLPNPHNNMNAMNHMNNAMGMQPRPPPQQYLAQMPNMNMQRMNSMQSMNASMYSQPYNYANYNNIQPMTGMGSQYNSCMPVGRDDEGYNNNQEDFDDGYEDESNANGGMMQQNTSGSTLRRAFSVSGGFHKFLNSQPYSNNNPQPQWWGGAGYGSNANMNRMPMTNNYYNNYNSMDDGDDSCDADSSLTESGDSYGQDGCDENGNDQEWGNNNNNNYSYTNNTNAMTNHVGRPMSTSSAMTNQPPPPSMGASGGMANSAVHTLGNNSSMSAVDQGMPAPGQLTRKESQKRIGMYFKNKSATEAEGVQYKDAKEATGPRGGAGMRDMSLTNRMKPILIRKRTGEAHFAETNGSTISLTPSGQDTAQEYKMTSIINADPDEDANITGDALNEICYNFVSGCNAGMIMADAGFDSAKPDSWYTWQALREVMKNAFDRVSSSAEMSVSVCLAQDDMVMDLLSDEPRKFVPLVVAENPLFGNVVNGVEFVYANDASEFNVTLDTCLERASSESKADEDEHGIIVVICVLKQTRRSQSTGKEDVIVSSLFASGVGDGVIHYTRILDKNPAEPRALFYSVMHRSVHSCAIFYCPDNDESVFQEYLTVLRRIGEVEVRNPKPGSMRMFTSFGQASIGKLTEDIEKIMDPRQRMMMDRYLAKMKLMVEDAEAMLKNPKEAVPKTYV